MYEALAKGTASGLVLVGLEGTYYLCRNPNPRCSRDLCWSPGAITQVLPPPGAEIFEVKLGVSPLRRRVAVDRLYFVETQSRRSARLRAGKGRAFARQSMSGPGTRRRDKKINGCGGRRRNKV